MIFSYIWRRGPRLGRAAQLKISGRMLILYAGLVAGFLPGRDVRAEDSVDDHGKIWSLTLIVSSEFEYPNKPSFVQGYRYHFDGTSYVQISYDEREANFFESDPLNLPPLSDYSQYNEPRFDYTLGHPGGQQTYAFGGGLNQLDIHEGLRGFDKTQVLFYSGVGIEKELNEKIARYPMKNVRLVKREGVGSAEDSASTFAYHREYRITDSDDPENYFWRMNFYSQTGPDGPYDLLESYDSSGTLHTRVVNSDFFTVGDTTFPRTIRVMRRNYPDRTITIKSVRVNEEIDPRLFEPIKVNPGAVIVLHQKDGNGDTITTRLDLPRPNQFTKVLEDLLTDQPDASEQVVSVNEPDKAEAKTDTNGAESVDASDQEEIHDHAPSRWRLPLALVLILGCGTAIFLARRKG